MEEGIVAHLQQWVYHLYEFGLTHNLGIEFSAKEIIWIIFYYLYYY